MTTNELLNITKHRPWELPAKNWKFYQEWNNAVFLHWQVEYEELRKFVPEGIEIDLFEGNPWVSLVAFTMEKVRPRGLPAFAPISDFDEINIRTYVKYKKKSGVYFLSIEAGSRISSHIARLVSELPYRYSKMERGDNNYYSVNNKFSDEFKMTFQVGQKVNDKTEIDKWLTERYALFQDAQESINEFEIHHIEWPIYAVSFKSLLIKYIRFEKLKLLDKLPDRSHFSTGVQVVTWAKSKTNLNNISYNK